MCWVSSLRPSLNAPGTGYVAINLSHRRSVAFEYLIGALIMTAPSVVQSGDDTTADSEDSTGSDTDSEDSTDADSEFEDDSPRIQFRQRLTFLATPESTPSKRRYRASPRQAKVHRPLIWVRRT